jgi:hypothetical protein
MIPEPPAGAVETTPPEARVPPTPKNPPDPPTGDDIPPVEFVAPPESARTPTICWSPEQLTASGSIASPKGNNIRMMALPREPDSSVQKSTLGLMLPVSWHGQVDRRSIHFLS